MADPGARGTDGGVAARLPARLCGCHGRGLCASPANRHHAGDLRDAHLGNFGFYAAPDRDLVIDLNDFDEAHPGAWEWDLRRLVTSIWVTGRDNGSTDAQCRDAAAACVAAYRDELRLFANESLLWRSYKRLDVDRLRATATEKGLRNEIERALAVGRSGSPRRDWLAATLASASANHSLPVPRPGAALTSMSRSNN
jgi:hypothetical protein